MKCFIPLDNSSDQIGFPEEFTFPFYYEPHPLAKLASAHLQQLIEKHKWNHNFGLNPNQSGLIIGKMFGVLVVKTKTNKLGYLAAFSGKIDESNHHEPFVPPVFDMLKKGSFFKEEEEIINQINSKIDRIEASSVFIETKSNYYSKKDKIDAKLKTKRIELKALKKERKKRKTQAIKILNETEFNNLQEQLKKESLSQQAFYKVLARKLNTILEIYEKRYDFYTSQIEELKAERKYRSAQLQDQLFEQYTFLDSLGNCRSLKSIFSETSFRIPPAGAGECAAPKLLQYAYKNTLDPICFAEFWWGASPKSQVRKHKTFYPACRSKCEPILGHMLNGLKVAPNPMLNNPAEGKTFKIVYEDTSIIVINKPSEFLSVPGKTITDSVYTRIKTLYPEAQGPLIIHRLDMSTSGLMVLAKTKKAYQFIQQQFIKRTVKKRYTAILDGIPTITDSLIDLPLRVDLDNRPRQLVCYNHGKKATTRWELIETKNKKTRVHFYPITGRTHQLRVHAAHEKGLNCSIVGDDLYGKKDKRLCLHAGYLSFVHPVTRETVSFSVAPDF